MAATHRFSVGDRVTFKPDPLDKNVRGGVYVVVRNLPETSQGRRLYRVKHAEDQFERVLEEQKLHAA